MIENAVKEYYKKLDKLWSDKRKTHPLIPYIEKIEPYNMYIGPKNQSDYVEWIIQKNSKVVDFSKIEKAIEIELKNEIKQYFSSYWFLNMTGLYENIIVSFTPITPLVDISVFIRERFNIAKEQNRNTDKIEIGIVEIDHDDGYLLLFDNSTGYVEAYDADKKLYQIVAKSLEALIAEMEPRC